MGAVRCGARKEQIPRGLTSARDDKPIEGAGGGAARAGLRDRRQFSRQLRPGNGGTRASPFLPLQDDVRRKNREGHARPDDGFAPFRVRVLPVGDAHDHASFEEDQRHGEAAGHPGAMRLHLALEDEGKGYAGGEHQHDRISYGEDGKRSRPVHALFVVLDVGAERSGDQRSKDVEASDHAMQLGVAQTKPVGKLHGAEEECAGPGESVRQQPPTEWVDVRPLRVGVVDQEALVVAKYVEDHEADEAKDQVLRAHPGNALQGGGCSSHRRGDLGLLEWNNGKKSPGSWGTLARNRPGTTRFSRWPTRRVAQPAKYFADLVRRGT